jgi:glutathione synthase/RimK-type ligase-like ATP-grasp enzyme
LRLETELIGDFGKPVSVIVDEDFIEDIVAKLKEVGATGWLLQRYIVADQGDRVWPVWADKRVGIGIISHGIFGNFGCFTMR